MGYVHERSNGTVSISSLPGSATRDERRHYLTSVREDVNAIFAADKSAIMLRRIDLDNGRRGGYFAVASVAVSELLTEVVDAVRFGGVSRFTPAKF